MKPNKTNVQEQIQLICYVHVKVKLSLPLTN
jgi:hypothetical protein